jgi:hypothetical protein
MMTSHRCPLLAVLVLVVAPGGLGCGSDAGVPHPDPLPIVARVRATALFQGTSGPVAVVGIPGAVGGAGAVSIVTLSQTFTATSTEKGSFALSVNSQAGAQLAIRYRSSDAALKDVAAKGVMAPLPPGPIAGVPPITALGGGRIRVDGRTQAGANMPIIIVNLRTGDVTQATSGAVGDFSAPLDGVTGDSLDVYDDIEPLASAWSLIVP